MAIAMLRDRTGKRVEVKIPDGWRRKTEGYAELGNRIWSPGMGIWVNVINDQQFLGHDVENLDIVLEKEPEDFYR